MPERLIFVRSRTTAGSSGWSSSFGISRRWCVACDGEYLVDATCPLLLQTSLKLYGIDGHVVLVLTFVFEDLGAVRFLAERERPIHLSKFPVLATVPTRFCNDCETSELFRLCSISLYLRLHGRDSGSFVNAQVQTSVPRSARKRNTMPDRDPAVHQSQRRMSCRVSPVKEHARAR